MWVTGCCYYWLTTLLWYILWPCCCHWWVAGWFWSRSAPVCPAELCTETDQASAPSDAYTQKNIRYGTSVPHFECGLNVDMEKHCIWWKGFGSYNFKAETSFHTFEPRIAYTRTHCIKIHKSMEAMLSSFINSLPTGGACWLSEWNLLLCDDDFS